jgi:hypothetical protein
MLHQDDLILNFARGNAHKSLSACFALTSTAESALAGPWTEAANRYGRHCGLSRFASSNAATGYFKSCGSSVALTHNRLRAVRLNSVAVADD